MEQRQNQIGAENIGVKTSGLVLAGASVLAVLTASCCILPLGLAIIGLGGSWLSILGPFVEYRDYLLVLVGLVVLGSWISLWRSPCGMLGNKNAFLIRLFVTLVFISAFTAPYWEDGIARSMWEYLRDNR